MDPEVQDSETLDSKNWDLEPWDPGTRDPDTQDPETGSLGLGTCDPETQNPERRIPRIELVTQIPSISTCTTGWINFLHAVWSKILIIKSYGIGVKNLGARVDAPKHLPKYSEIWHNTKKLENM